MLQKIFIIIDYILRNFEFIDILKKEFLLGVNDLLNLLYFII
jgi:hypothetical protein